MLGGTLGVIGAIIARIAWLRHNDVFYQVGLMTDGRLSAKECAPDR